MADLRKHIALALALILTVGIAGCGNDITVGDVEPVTVTELDTAVQGAASAVLARAVIAVIYFDAADPLRVLRYDWIDYRNTGQALAVYQHLDSDYTEGLILDAGSWITALDSPSDSQPWQVDSVTGLAMERLPALDQLTRMATTGRLDDVPETATRQTASDGSQLWTLQTADADLVYEWIISPSGLLNFYRVFSSAGLESGAGTVIYEYGVSDADPDAIVVPAAGTPLLLDDLEIPPALRNLEEPE